MSSLISAIVNCLLQVLYLTSHNCTFNVLQIKQSNQLSLPHQDDFNTRMDINARQNIEQLQTPTMGVTRNKKTTTTEAPP